MKRVSSNDLTLWQFQNLSNETGINHFVSDRSSGGSNDFTLSLSSTPDRDLVVKNRARIASAMGVDREFLFFPSQIHETKIVHVTSKTEKTELMDTDALVTNQRGICIAVMSADCVPILLYDRINKAVAAIHSGWRGTVARILQKTLTKMSETFGTKGSDVVAGIGPSVSQPAYEVGEEVVHAVIEAFPNVPGLLEPQENKKAKLDLWRANKIQLLEFGVPENQIEISNLCTVRNNEYFFSARKGDKGRFAAGILIN